ncbi:MAG: RluA family pseudouridine synthase [Clostridia bacterium]|nr:RluA family pseudouridine synthase [Clostridia bacterium]
MKVEDLEVIYEDNHIVVVIKPQNIPTQEDESKDMDMLTLVKEYIKIKYNKPGKVYIGLVHRLDRPTGGLLVFARTSKAASRLSEQIKNGEFDKRYLTILNGVPNERTKKLENYLKKDERTNIVKIVTRSEEGAKKAELIYNVIDTYSEYIEIPKRTEARTRINQNEILNKEEETEIKTEKREINKLSLVEVELLTGRSHQIRVQMANLKTSVYGDVKYGGIKDDDSKMTNKLALWAYKLSFVHPTTKNIMNFKVLPPIDTEPWIKFSKNEIFKN